MGNVCSSGSAGRRRSGSRRSHHHPPPPPATPAGAPGQYYHHYAPPSGAMPVPLPAPYDHHHRGGQGRFPPAAAPPYVEHQKSVTIRNDVNLKKESLRVDADVDNPGMFLVSFTFDATVSGCMTIIFFAKEGEDCNLTPTKENRISPVTVRFEQGLGQKFIQPAGSGIELSTFEESELMKLNDMDVYPLVVKAEASPEGKSNSQITLAVFERDKGGEIRARVSKQILWVNGMRYELQEIYGIGNSVEGDLDGNDPGKECVICLSEPRDTTVLPCRHMCMCGECAKVLRFQTNRCPICRQPVERLLEIRVNSGSSE